MGLACSMQSRSAAIQAEAAARRARWYETMCLARVRVRVRVSARVRVRVRARARARARARVSGGGPL